MKLAPHSTKLYAAGLLLLVLAVLAFVQAAFNRASLHPLGSEPNPSFTYAFHQKLPERWSLDLFQ
jgi:hypothetical protein